MKFNDLYENILEDKSDKNLAKFEAELKKLGMDRGDYDEDYFELENRRLGYHYNNSVDRDDFHDWANPIIKKIKAIAKKLGLSPKVKKSSEYGNFYVYEYTK
jgi:hypothetical protein